MLQPLSSNFKIALKTAILLALVVVKHCSDLTLLCIDNQFLCVQYYAKIFIPASSGKVDQQGDISPQIHVQSHCDVNICNFFYLKDY